MSREIVDACWVEPGAALSPDLVAYEARARECETAFEMERHFCAEASPRRDGRAPPRLPPIPRAPLLVAGDPPRPVAGVCTGGRHGGSRADRQTVPNGVGMPRR